MSKAISRKRVVPIAVLIGLYSFGSLDLRAGFEPPEEQPGLGNQIEVLTLELRENRSSAGARLAELWAGSGAAIVREADGALVSMAGWVNGVAPAQREVLSKQLSDAPTTGAVLAAVQAAARDEPTASPLQLYARTRAVPLGAGLGPALAVVAERAVAWGDLVTARDLYAAALATGWTADGPRAGAIASAAETTVARPLALPAPWYGNAKALQEPRLLPVAAGDVTYVGGLAGVAAVRGDEALWTNIWGAAEDIVDSAPLPGGAGRGPLVSPAILGGAGDGAQIIVVNTPATAELPGTLRAIRASDGKTLWESTDDDANRALRFVGPAAVAGRYVYATAMRTDGRLGTLLVACIDVTNGRSLWQTTLGSVTDTARDGNRKPLEHHWHAGAPLVSGDQIFLAPGVGFVMALNRFDGALLWARPYTVTDADEGQVRQFRDQLRNRQKNATPPIPERQAQRFAGGVARVGDVLVVAPLDTPAVLGLSATSGRTLWERADLPAPNLVGVAGASAIFSGADVRAIDPATGADRWTATVAVAGPVVIEGDGLLAPTADGVVAINVASGAVSATRPAVPTFAAGSPVATTLQTIGAGDLLQVAEPRK